MTRSTRAALYGLELGVAVFAAGVVGVVWTKACAHVVVAHFREFVGG